MLMNLLKNRTHRLCRQGFIQPQPNLIRSVEKRNITAKYIKVKKFRAHVLNLEHAQNALQLFADTYWLELVGMPMTVGVHIPFW